MPDKQSGAAARRTPLVKTAVLAVLLVAAWLLWSGIYKPLLLGLGLFSCVLVLYLSWRMHLLEQDVFSLRYFARLVRYWAWLGREIWRSSITVTRIVLSPKLPISPTVIEFDAHCAHPVDRAILGNSITLTPGTLTLHVDETHFIVHALTEEGAWDIAEGEMDRRVSDLRRD